MPLQPQQQPPDKPPFKYVMGLRFRLALSYVLFFGLLLIMVGFAMRGLLGSIIDREIRGVLEEEWVAVKGYMRIENRRPSWTFERYDPEEREIIERLRSGAFMVAAEDGTILDMSSTYKSLGPEKPPEIQEAIRANRPSWIDRMDDYGYPYKLRAGVVYDQQHRPYYLVVGKPVAEYQNTVDIFTRNYFALIPVALVASGLLGWLLARRALQPLNDVAAAAKHMRGSNLKVEIPLRGANDELERLIESFNAMSARLASSFEQMRQFSTDVSHELRTPLTAIRGQLEVALFTAETTDQYRDAMFNALQDVEQLSNIVRALLLLSQAESGQLALQLSPLRIAAVVEDLGEQFQLSAEDQKVDLTIRIDDPEALVRADRTQIVRLVTNLLSNAVKYTQSGGKVEVHQRNEGGHLVLSVRDTGMGIPPENLPHIFDRFYRVRPAHTHPAQGLGLGLSFVDWIVKVHDGQITVESAVGKGTTFTVRLPLVDPASIRASDASHHSTVPAPHRGA